MGQTRLAYTLTVVRKWCGIIVLLLPFAAVSLALGLVPLGPRLRRAARARTCTFFARLALGLLGVRVHIKHQERLREHRTGRLVVANHVSYVDILVLSSLSPLVFITSVEMKHTPLLGRLAVWGGSLFVERRRPHGLKQEIDEISQVLAHGFSVVLFPEGTTSNGDRVHPFKRALFDAAVSADVDVLPLCVRYTAIDGAPLSQENRDELFYYGGARFSEHFPRFLALRAVEAEVQVLGTIKVQHDLSRKQLAVRAHESVCSAYQP